MIDDSDSDYTLEDSDVKVLLEILLIIQHSVEVHRNRQMNSDDDNRFFPGKIAKS